jgi:hypothetical protein
MILYNNLHFLFQFLRFPQYSGEFGDSLVVSPLFLTPTTPRSENISICSVKHKNTLPRPKSYGNNLTSFNPEKYSGNCKYHLLGHSNTFHIPTYPYTRTHFSTETLGIIREFPWLSSVFDCLLSDPFQCILHESFQHSMRYSLS